MRKDKFNMFLAGVTLFFVVRKVSGQVYMISKQCFYKEGKIYRSIVTQVTDEIIRQRIMSPRNKLLNQNPLIRYALFFKSCAGYLADLK
jgi:hypothetical protein